MGPLILIVGWIVWWFRGTLFEREVAGLEGEKGVLEQRLKSETSILEQRLKFAEEVKLR
jgi:hypothetical protein